MKHNSGKKFEVEAQKILEAQGWATFRAANKIVWIGPNRPISQSHDFFGVWDLVCKKENHATLWVQVTTWEMVSVRRAKILTHPYPWLKDKDVSLIMGRVRKDRPPRFRLLWSYNNYLYKEHEWEVIKKEAVK